MGWSCQVSPGSPHMMKCARCPRFLIFLKHSPLNFMNTMKLQLHWLHVIIDSSLIPPKTENTTISLPEKDSAGCFPRAPSPVPIAATSWPNGNFSSKPLDPSEASRRRRWSEGWGDVERPSDDGCVLRNQLFLGIHWKIMGYNYSYTIRIFSYLAGGDWTMTGWHDFPLRHV